MTVITENTLELVDVTKTFGSMKALDSVNIRVAPHEVVGLIGENGAGKSTLLKLLAGVHQQNSGELIIRGQKQRMKAPSDGANLGIGVVHQEQSLIVNLTVAENLHLGSAGTPGEKRGVNRLGLYNWAELNRQAETALRRIGSSIDPTTIVEDLSFTDRQMVEIAKAVQVAEHSGAEPLLILDEPTAILEPQETEILEREVARLKQLGSVIFVSHRLQEVLRVSDRIYVLRHGRVVGERNSKDVVEEELFQLMTGRESRQTANEAVGRTLGRQVLSVQGLTRRGHFRDVSFSIRAGEVCAFVGANGSGRDELARALFGAEPFDSGTFSVDGRPARSMRIRRAIRSAVAYLPSERKTEGMVAGLSVSENLTLAHPVDGQNGPIQLPGKRRAAMRRWIAKMDVRPADPDIDIARLSGGNQQKVVLGKWFLAKKLKVAILDHPLRGLDPGAKESVAQLIAEAAAAGCAIMLLADTLEEALGNGNSIIVMKDGTITERHNLAERIPALAELVEGMV